MNLDEELETELATLQTAQRRRSLRSLGGADRVHVQLDDGEPLLSFCSNDYLGLASHPSVKAAAIQAIQEHGVGAGASRLVSGQAPAHRVLETALAEFLGLPDALLFPTGYQANLGAVTALAGPEDLIVSDAANHASIIDACRLSRAKVVIYRHSDTEAAARALVADGPFVRRVLVTESIFSMDGDRAPLPDLARAARAHGALFMVDEAHALGVVGPQGRGLAADTGVTPDVLIGTLGKAFGAHGGLVAGSGNLRDFLVNRARQFIYTTAAPPAVAAAASAALRHVQSPEGEALRRHAVALAAHARMGLRGIGLEIPGQDLILPILVGSASRALEISAALLRQGILVPAIRPPTVPNGTSRLRVTISAMHTLADVDRLIQAIVAAGAMNAH